MPLFKYALVDKDGEIFDEVENAVSNWKAGDVLIAAGNVRYRVTTVIPLPKLEEFVEAPAYGMLEVERL